MIPRCRRCGSFMDTAGLTCSECLRQDVAASTPAVILPEGVTVEEVRVESSGSFVQPMSLAAAEKAGLVLTYRHGHDLMVHCRSTKIRLVIRQAS